MLLRNLVMFLVITGALATTACDDSADGDGDADADADSDVDGDVDGDADADHDGGIECAFGDAFVAQFDRICSEDEDCVVGICAVDCCGTGMAVGINAAEAERFEPAWAACAAELPQCGCPSGPTHVDDGSTTWDHDSIRVRCDGDQCRTYLP